MDTLRKTPQNGGGKGTSKLQSSTAKKATETKTKSIDLSSEVLEEKLKKALESEAKAKQEIEQSKQAQKKAEELALKVSKEAETSKTENERLTKQLSSKKPMTVVEAMLRIAEAKSLAEKMEYLQDVRKNLSNFTLGSSAMTCSLELKDNNGKSFLSSNTDTVKLVLKILKDQLDKMLSEAEIELLEAA